jgi:murein DD-endopeptidase MepM/ murein hydrolase activator NlpD
VDFVLLAAATDRCPAGRHEGEPIPSWWPKVHALIRQNAAAFPSGLPAAFLGAWIEHESDGRPALSSKYSEVGYFQLHPDEIGELIGHKTGNIDKSTSPWTPIGPVADVVVQIKASPTTSMRWGARLLGLYDHRLQSIGAPRGTNLYLGLMKASHWSPFGTLSWAKHVHAVLGYWPGDYDTFLQTAQDLAAGRTTKKLGEALPSKLPSCSAVDVLRRAAVFRDEAGGFDWGALAGLHIPFLFVGSPLIGRGGLSGSLGGVIPGIPTFEGFPGVSFHKPLDIATVSSGWRDDRSYRGEGAWHEGMDMHGPVGVPVYAVAAGTVVRVDNSDDSNAGLWVGIKHAHGWASQYIHLSRIDVRTGQSVRAGQRIGALGRSGAASSGAHLHLTMRLDKELLPLYRARYGEPAGGFGREMAPMGVAVPAEPLIPVDGYQDDVIAAAAKHSIPLHGGGGINLSGPWSKVAVVGVAAVLIAGVTYAVARR